jgi:hypothetical protein
MHIYLFNKKFMNIEFIFINFINILSDESFYSLLTQIILN